MRQTHMNGVLNTAKVIADQPTVAEIRGVRASLLYGSIHAFPCILIPAELAQCKAQAVVARG